MFTTFLSICFLQVLHQAKNEVLHDSKILVFVIMFYYRFFSESAKLLSLMQVMLKTPHSI